MAETVSEISGQPIPNHGEFVWTEIASNDADKCREFYTAVFGWKFQEGDAASGMKYDEFATISDHPAGGLYQMDPAWFGGTTPPPHFLNYVAVDDVDENAELAVELGGTIIRGPMDIPNVGRMALIQDPTGAMIATFKAEK